MPGTEQKNKGGMTNARIAGGNVETIEFDKVNNGGRTPVPPAPPAPPAPSTTHQDMYKAVTKAPLSEADEQAKRKKQLKQSTLAAILDGLSALGNVWFATRGANATGTTNLSQGVSGKWKDYWDQVRKDRNDYNKGLLAAQKMDYNADVRKLERAEDKAERDAVRAQQQSNWETTRQDGLMKDAQQQSNWKMIFDANDAQRAEQNDINRKQLGIAQQNATTAANKTKGEYIALDEEGNEHLFTDKNAADDFALQHGTHTYEMVEKTITAPDPLTGELTTKTIKEPVLVRNGKTQKKANPMGEDKKPNPMK